MIRNKKRKILECKIVIYTDWMESMNHQWLMLLLVKEVGGGGGGRSATGGGEPNELWTGTKGGAERVPHEVKDGMPEFGARQMTEGSGMAVGGTAVAVGAGPPMMQDAAVAVGGFPRPRSGVGGVTMIGMGTGASSVDGDAELMGPQVTEGATADMGDGRASAEVTPRLGGYGPNRVGRKDQSSSDECASCLKAATTGDSICEWSSQRPSKKEAEVRYAQAASWSNDGGGRKVTLVAVLRCRFQLLARWRKRATSIWMG